MITDSGVNRRNFDSSGLSTGYAVGALMYDAQAEILQNVRKAFMSYPDTQMSGLTDAWRASMLAQYESIRQSGVAAFKAKQPAILAAANISLANGFNIGVKETLAEVPKKPQEQTYALSKTEKGQIIAGSLNDRILKAEAEAVNSAGLLFLNTIAMVSAGIMGGTLYEAIDRVFLPEAEKGLAGKTTSNARKISLPEYSEGVTRESSQTALLAGKGAVAQALEYYYVQISAHPSCCPLCLPWQEKILIDDVYAQGKPDGKTELLSTAIAAGLFHWNCRHSYIVVIPGYSRTDLYSYDRATDKESLLRYEVEQAQRNNERQIRGWKIRRDTALTAQERSSAGLRVNDWQARQRELKAAAEQQGIPFYRQYSREQIGGGMGRTLPDVPGLESVRSKIFNLSYSEAEHLKGKMSNEIARNYYVEHIKRIDNAIDKALLISEQARQAFEMRNEARLFVRELMSDNQTAKSLEITNPNYTWDKIIEHKKAKGLTDEEVFIYIIRTATESNKSVDAIFNIRR